MGRSYRQNVPEKYRLAPPGAITENRAAGLESGAVAARRSGGPARAPGRGTQYPITNVQFPMSNGCGRAVRIEGRDGAPRRPGGSGSRVGRPRLSSVALAKEGRGRRAVCRPGLHPRRDSGGGSQYPIFNNQFSTFNGQGGAGIDHPFSRKDAEGAEDVPPGSNPGRGRAAERGGFIVCRIAPLHSKTSFHRTDPLEFRNETCPQPSHMAY